VSVGLRNDFCNLLGDTGVLEDMLAKVLAELEDVGGGGGGLLLRRAIVWTARAAAIALGCLDLAHNFPRGPGLFAEGRVRERRGRQTRIAKVE